jgi:ubiquinone/menaquinone biosynthesis C-methylase UbiE
LIDEAISRGVPSSARFAVASAYALPFDDASFDAVRAERVFQHLNDADTPAREMKRVLAPGGSALLLDQDWDTLMISGSERSLTARIVRALADHVVNPWAGREAAGLLCRAGFADVEVLPSIGTPTFSLATHSILRPAMQAAVQANVVDARTADQWLESLLEADLRCEFFCGVVVIVALGKVG